MHKSFNLAVMRYTNTLVFAFVLLIALTGCEERIEGDSYVVSGYIVPDTLAPDSVLKGQWLHIYTSMGPVNQARTVITGDGSSHWTATDSAGYFSQTYKDPDYWENHEDTREVVNMVQIELVNGYGQSNNNPYIGFPGRCNYVNQKLVSRN